MNAGATPGGKPNDSYSPGALRSADSSRKLTPTTAWPAAKLMGVWRSFQWPSSGAGARHAWQRGGGAGGMQRTQRASGADA